ncbi:MAG: hypothetical protein ACE5IH_06205, partial [Thermodesulfobacteriota bacterium]
KARTAEAKSNIGSINTLQEAYAAETDQYITSVANPDVTSLWDGQATSWTASGVASDLYIEGIGFKPKGNLYFAYSVGPTAPNAAAATLTEGTNGLVAANNNTNIYIMAAGNLDDDAGASFTSNLSGQYSSNDENRTVVNNNPAEF